MNKVKKISKVAIVVGTLSLLPILALAINHNTVSVPGNINTVNDVYRILENVVNLIFGVLMAISTFLVLYAAYLYLTSSGDEGKLESARNTIIYAAVGIGIAMLAKGFASIVSKILQ